MRDDREYMRKYIQISKDAEKVVNEYKKADHRSSFSNTLEAIIWRFKHELLHDSPACE